MKPSSKKWLVRFAVLCSVLFLFGCCLRDFWIGQLRIYLLGMLEVRADEFGYRLPDVDEVQIMGLRGDDAVASNDENHFESYLVLGHAVLHGDDATKITNLWRSLRRSRGFSAMCHDPVYALRFRQRGKVIFETTICWKCHNYTIPMGLFGRTEYGFDSDRSDAQTLFTLLQSFVPLPKKPSA